MPPAHPVFVVGAPRTGTTLVKEILNRHPAVHLFDEVHFFERIWDDRAHLGDLSTDTSRRAAVERVLDIVRRFGSDADVAEALPIHVYDRGLVAAGPSYPNLARILFTTQAARRGASVWGDSSPQDILYLATILSWWPDAKIVALVRDPRGFLSSYKNYHRRGVATYRERYNPLPVSMLWKSYMTALLEAEKAPWGASVMRLRYEDLVAEPEKWVRRLSEHVGVEFVPAMLEVERANTSFVQEQGGAPRRRGIFSTSADRWRTELTPTEIWLGERICGDVMRELGYEPASNGQAPSAMELAKVAALLPGRAFNLLFRTGKPFTFSKLARVLTLFRKGS
ncbi:MAG: sulfotransferase [bacterium]